MSRKQLLISTLLILIFQVVPDILAEEPNLLIVNIWCELEPMIAVEEEYPLSREEAYKRILSEARAVLSGMIYGFEFSYTPSDRQRKISEDFRLLPIAEIKWGDKNLKILDTVERDKKLFARVHYRLRDFQGDRREAWSSNTIPLVSGSGEGNLFKGTGEKKSSLSEAIKNAIRNHLRPVIFNKPREIIGAVLIWEEPQTIIKAGSYLTRVNIKLRIKEITPYRIF